MIAVRQPFPNAGLRAARVGVEAATMKERWRDRDRRLVNPARAPQGSFVNRQLRGFLGRGLVHDYRFRLLAGTAAPANDCRNYANNACDEYLVHFVLS